MDPIFGGLITGGISAVANLFGANQNNKNAMAMQQQQQAFTERMSSTAYQRASTDMKAAGLNPAMMFGSGSAASTPAAPQAQQLQSPIREASAGIDKMLSSAIQLKSIDKMAEEIAKLKTSEGVDAAHERVLGVEAGLKAEEAGKVVAETRLRKAALPVALNEALTAKHESEISPSARRILDVAGFTGRRASDVMSPVGTAVGSAKGVRSLFNDRFYY